MRRPAKLLFLGLLALIAVPAAAAPETGEERQREREEAEAGIAKPLLERPFNQAREESGVERRPRSRHPLPGGELRLSAERLAAARQPLRFRLDLDRPTDRGELVLRLPRLWVKRSAVSGLPFARVPGGRRKVVLDASDPTLVIDDVGIPAGTYLVPYRLRRGGQTAKTGVARVILYAPVREQHARNSLTTDLRVNATSDSLEESEAFIAAMPGNSDRVAVGINTNDFDPAGDFHAWVSANRGASWVKRPMPTTTDAPGTAIDESSVLCCDPMFAADTLGNIWYGGLTTGAGAPDSRIVVNRIAAGGDTFQTKTVGLPERSGGGAIQDKPMMTIDNTATSPKFGNLYVVWDEPSAGGVNIVISQCDTTPTIAACDNADNWTTPVTIASNGSYIYADVAVGPDGTVYVVWWDYSSTNAIRGDSCGPAQNCATAGVWSAGGQSTIATLDTSFVEPVPFACPILAQPGGRAAPATNIDVSRAAADSGRVYVTWSDLRPGSGTTKCFDTDDPLLSHLTWDSFVASALNTLPGGSAPSASIATRLHTDGEAAAEAPNSDEWFPWLSVDQSTGQAYADFYSTRHDTTRQTTHFYVRAVTPTGDGSHTLGALTRVSAFPSDYSFEPCCDFGNQYGDYEGIDAAEGAVYPVWTDNSTGTGDGEAFTVVPTLSLAPQSATATETSGDGDGVLEPGESASLVVTTVNASTVGGTSISATLTSPTSGITITQGSSAYPDLRATKTGTNTTLYTLSADNGVPCDTTAQLDLAYSATQQDTGGSVPSGGSIGLPILCPPGPISGLGATAQPSAVTLDWDDALRASGYDIFRKAGGAYSGTPTASSTFSFFTDTNLPNGTQQCYKVRATNAAGTGPDSSEVCATPTAPTGGGGGTGGGGTGGGGTEPDLTAPAVSVGGRKRQRIGRTRAVTVTARCSDERCTFTASGNVNVPRTARTFRLRGASGSAAAGATVKLKLRLTRKTVRAVRKALRARRRVRARITVRAVDQAGNARVARITVRARR